MTLIQSLMAICVSASINVVVAMSIISPGLHSPLTLAHDVLPRQIKLLHASAHIPSHPSRVVGRESDTGVRVEIFAFLCPTKTQPIFFFASVVERHLASFWYVQLP